MTKITFTIFVSFLIGLFLLSSAEAQTVEELKKENQELKERLKLLEENSDLRAKIDALKSGKATAAPSPTPTPKTVEENNKENHDYNDNE